MKLKDVLRSVEKQSWKIRPEVLLCMNVPKPMHGVAPRVVLGSKWWNATRQEAYKSTKYHCIACGVHKDKARSKKWLEGHELYNIDYSKGLMFYVETVPLCHYCHNYIHDGRMLGLMQNGQFSHGKYKAVIEHGDRVLLESGLSRLSYEDREESVLDLALNGKLAEWSKWRLVIGRKKYGPKFKTEYAWRQAFK